MIIEGLKLFPKQEEIITKILKSKSKFCLLNASRQASKTTILEQLSMYYLFNDPGCVVLWVSPQFSVGKKSYQNILDNIIVSGVVKKQSVTEQYLDFINGSKIIFKSDASADAIRGISSTYVFCDEFSYFNPDNFNSIIRPTGAVTGKKFVISSTPRGKNHFYELCLLGQSDNPNYSYYFMHYSDNPYYSTEEIADARATLPTAIFETEYEAKFLDSSFSVFQDIDNHAVIDKWSEPVRGERYYAGLDLAKQIDWSVLSICNSKGEVVYIYRDNIRNWNSMIARFIEILKKYNATCLIEVNNIGDVVLDTIKASYRHIQPYITSAASKEILIENLIYAFNSGQLKIPTEKLFKPLYDELGVFGFEYSKRSRSISYSAPKGFGDDCVLSLGLMSYCRKTSKSGKYMFR